MTSTRTSTKAYLTTVTFTVVEKRLQSVISVSSKVHVMLKRLCSHPRDIEALMYQVLDSSSGQGWLVERVCLNAFSVMWK
jgi:hypothetical protein